MFEGGKAAAVHSPATLAELITLRRRLPDALLWAGGTDIMGRTRQYPASDGIDIIYLGNVQELKRISRSERYLEIGALVSVENMLNVGQHILHPVLSKACMESSPRVIRSQATFGGSLSIPRISLNIPTALSVLETQVETRSPNAKKNGGKWMPVHRLFNRMGERTSIEPAIITRVRILLEESDFHFFESIGEPYLYPQQSVILAVFSQFNLPAISEYRFALTFPQYGIFRNREIETAVSGSDLPFSHRDIRRIAKVLKKSLDEVSFPLTDLQRIRATRVFELSLHRMNQLSIRY